MINLITTTSRYAMLIFMAVYTLIAFFALSEKTGRKRKNRYFYYQNVLLFLFLAYANVVLFANSEDFRYLFAFVMEAVLIISVLVLYTQIYPGVEKSLLNFMLILLSIGLVVLSRLSLDRFIHQYLVALLGLAISLAIPYFVNRFRTLNQWTYVYGTAGILLLFIVYIAGSTEYGAKLSIQIGSMSFQPTEFVKLLFVMFLASGFSGIREKTKLKEVEKVFLLILIAGIHFLILMGSRDLGGMSILFVVLVGIFYIWTQNIIVPILGFGSIVAGVILLSTVFSHVSERLMAWRDPLAYAEDQGYQLSQSLFAIGGGGWFGSGLMQGMPEKIPVVAKDFIFAAISEEFGALFAICLILLSIACFLMMMNVAVRVKRPFYKYMATGFATIYAFQLLLSVGGVIRFIPSTGVTLPFISYGGSSLVSMMILFSMIQGIYLIEGEDRIYAEE